MTDQTTPVTDDRKKTPEWPKTRTTILDARSGEEVNGKRVIVETYKHGKHAAATYALTTDQITRSQFDLLEETERRCIEELTRVIEGTR